MIACLFIWNKPEAICLVDYSSKLLVYVVVFGLFFLNTSALIRQADSVTMLSEMYFAVLFI